MARPATAVRTAATIAGAAYAVALYLSGVHVQAGVKQALSYLPTAMTFVVALWDIYLWRLPLLQRLTKRPWITGVWTATLIPTKESVIPKGGNLGPIEAYVIIEQTFWSIAVRQYTAESRSGSNAAMWIEPDGGSSRRLTYTYANRPRQELEHRNRAHLGTAALDIVGLRPSVISGDYFTDRYTKGDMTLHLVDRTTGHADFASAADHCRPVGP